MIRVSIVEDDSDIRQSLELLINEQNSFECAATYPDCQSAVKGIVAEPPDVVLMDLGLPDISGIEGIRLLKAQLPDLPIIVLTVNQEDESLFEALCAGAGGYLTKSNAMQDIVKSIQEVHDGGAPMSASVARKVVQSFQTKESSSPLTDRETEVLNYLCRGESYKMIADGLCISVQTVHTHIKHIYKKLEVNSKSQAVAKALRDNLVDP